MASKGLYSPQFEHDSCGIGFVANIKSQKSHQIVSDSLTILENMEHRGACGCENNTGDGAGIMIQMPHEFFVDECSNIGIALPEYGRYGVGVIFFPKDKHFYEESRKLFDKCAAELNLKILGYRKVPVNNAEIGFMALSVEPHMEQVFIKCPNHIDDLQDFERKLFVLRNYTTHLINKAIGINDVGFYIASLS